VDKPETISGILLLCYVKGVSQIILKFSKSDQYIKSKKIIWEILSHLEGFKIIEENPENIIIEYFYNKYEVNILKIAKRMVFIANQMIECIRLKDNQTKKILENEMDSLYHLSKRILYLASIDPQIKTKNNIQDIEEIFLWRLIFKKIENIGDLIDRLVFYKKKTYLDIETTLSSLNDLFIYSKLVDTAKIDMLKNRKFGNEYAEKMNNLVIDILNNYMLIELNRKIFSENFH
jgi:phosphate uptake regulator